MCRSPGFLICLAFLSACSDSATGPQDLEPTVRPMFASVYAGNGVTCGLTTEGDAYCWGTQYDAIPELVPGGHSFTSITVSEAGNNHSFGNFHACGIDEGGRAYCWGENEWGQLGNGENRSVAAVDSYKWVAEPVAVLGDLRFEAVAAGADNTCGLTADGSVYCWGQNEDGHLGTFPSTFTDPTLFATELRFERLSSGKWFKCAITAQEETYCWGDDNYGQLGDDAGGLPVNPMPSRVVGVPPLTSVTSGWQHTCGLTSLGGVTYCWGRNIAGQLNDGTTEDRDSGGVSGFDMPSFRSVDAGSWAICGLTTEGRVYCWGKMNMSGGGFESELVTGIPEMTAVSVGTFHACGVSTDHWIYCWGMGYFGQLGRSRENNIVPYAYEPGPISNPR